MKGYTVTAEVADRLFDEGNPESLVTDLAREQLDAAGANRAAVIYIGERQEDGEMVKVEDRALLVLEFIPINLLDKLYSGLSMLHAMQTFLKDLTEVNDELDETGKDNRSSSDSGGRVHSDLGYRSIRGALEPDTPRPDEG